MAPMETKPAALVVENDDPIAEALKFVFEQMGFEVKRAVDCKSAAELIGAMPTRRRAGSACRS
jgi:DNA-binding response OmpR family regulator